MTLWLTACVFGSHSVAARNANSGLTAGFDHRIGCEVTTRGAVTDAGGNVLWSQRLPACDWTVGEVRWEGDVAVFHCGANADVRAGPWPAP